MNKVLYQLSRANLTLGNCGYPYPAWCIAETLKITVNQARYRLNKLKKLGLVRVISMSIDDSTLPYRGWYVTDEGRKTKEYQLAKKEEKELQKMLWGGNEE